MARFELASPTIRAKPRSKSSVERRIGSDVAVRNVLWFITLRWIVVAVFLAAEFTAVFIGPALRDYGIEAPRQWPWILALILSAANICFLIHARKLVAQVHSGAGVYINLWIQIVVDLATLTVVVHYLGSLTTFICFAYLFHTGLACIFFPPRWSLIVTLLVCLLYVGCVVLELSGLIPAAGIYTEQINQMLRAGLLDSPLRVSIHVGSAIGIFLVVWYLASNLSTAVREKDRQLLIANERLLAADRERTQHMLHTTHELKAPFAAIQSYVQLLMKGYCGSITDEAREVLVKIDARSQRLSNQIREMLQLANLRSAAARSQARHTVSLVDMLERVIASSRAMAEARNISFQTDLQEVSIEGVANQLEMMLTNIVANAVQYSHPAGTVNISCRQADTGVAEVEIVDQGIGIREDALEHIFEEYYRSKEAAEHNPMCTGLGLAIVKHIASTHKLRVQVESELGRGTKFVLTFPPARKTSHL